MAGRASSWGLPCLVWSRERGAGGVRWWAGGRAGGAWNPVVSPTNSHPSGSPLSEHLPNAQGPLQACKAAPWVLTPLYR